jgi:CTP:molybdopterin cytidylyltransferase MocA
VSLKPSSSPAAIILAAGASSRMGRVKALLELDGESFVTRLARVLGVHCDPVVVVLGHHADAIREAAPGLEFAVNPDPERGMLSSLQTGLAAVDRSRGVLFTPVDTPAVSEATVARLAAALADGAPAAVPVFGGKRGHPVAISGELARQLLALPLTERANSVIRSAGGIEIPVEDPGVVLEVDTPADYRELLCRVG